MLHAILISIEIVKPYDTLYNIDLSGDKQVVYVGRHPKPLRLKIYKDGQPLAYTTVDVFFVSSKEVRKFKFITDSLGNLIVHLPALEDPGRYHIIVSIGENYDVFRMDAIPKLFYLLVFLQMLGGFVIFLYGMEKLNQGINRIIGANIKHYLTKFSSNPLIALIIGIFATITLQSSTALTVMLVSFVDVGMISLASALAIALGAGIGSTAVAQIISFGLFDLAFALIVLGYALKKTSGIKRSLGNALFGIGLIFFSIKLMSMAGSSLSELDYFNQAIRSFSENPLLGIGSSFLLTSLVHSSAAVVGLAISLAYENLIDIDGGIYIVLGANIGTATTALLASLRSGASGRRIALANFIYKLTTLIAVLVLFEVFKRVVVLSDPSLPRQIANAHTFFNVFGALLFLPFVGFAEKLFTKLIPDTHKVKETTEMYEEMDTQAIVSHMHRLIHRMSYVVEDMLNKIPDMLSKRDVALIFSIEEMDNRIDELRHRILKLFLTIQELEPDEDDMRNIEIASRIADQLEIIGDIVSKNLARNAYKLYKEGLSFSHEGMEDILSLHREILITYNLMNSLLINYQDSKEKECMARRELVNNIMDSLIQKHFERVREGIVESFMTSAIHVEVLQNLERINYHITEICRYLRNTKA